MCSSWAGYINANAMTPEEAIDFVRKSVSTPGVMAHLLVDGPSGLCGLSTVSRAGDETDFSVSYKNVDIFSNGIGEFLREDSAVNVTRAYTNPVNAIRSIAFCCPVTLRDGESGEALEAVLLRIIPASGFEQKWAFPTEEYDHAEISLIDLAGNYIIKGHSFKNSNLFEFYQSYNNPGAGELEELKSSVAGPPGTLEMTDSTGQRCILAHTRVDSTDDWILAALIPRKELSRTVMNWALVGIVTGGGSCSCWCSIW